MEKDLLKVIARFVAEQNLLRCGKSAADIKAAANELYREELSYEESTVFTATDRNGELLASIRMLLWNRRDILPLEETLGIDVSTVVTEQQAVWHIGRLAIRTTEETGSGFLLKYMMLAALEEIASDARGVALAECDVRLVRTVRKLGLEVTELGPATEHLGSLTVPVLLAHSGIVQFITRHLHLKGHVPHGIRLERYIYQLSRR